MNYAEWIEKIEPRRTEEGARLDVRLLVHPDGRGSICLVDPIDKSEQPVGDVAEAVRVFQDLWQKASMAQSLDDGDSRIQLAGLLEKITEENIHALVDDGGPVGNEVW